jgi:hypothetical protein
MRGVSFWAQSNVFGRAMEAEAGCASKRGRARVWRWHFCLSLFSFAAVVQVFPPSFLTLTRGGGDFFSRAHLREWYIDVGLVRRWPVLGRVDDLALYVTTLPRRTPT